MRTGFRKGIIAGGIIGAIASFMAGDKNKTQVKRDAGCLAKLVSEKASKMFRGKIKNS